MIREREMYDGDHKDVKCRSSPFRRPTALARATGFRPLCDPAHKDQRETPLPSSPANRRLSVSSKARGQALRTQGVDNARSDVEMCCDRLTRQCAGRDPLPESEWTE